MPFKLPLFGKRSSAGSNSLRAGEPTVTLEGKPSVPGTITAEILLACPRLGDTVLSQVWRYDESTVIKRVDEGIAAEVAAMRLASKQTSIPVPKIINVVQHDAQDAGFIVMEYIQGQPLDKEWKTLADAQKQQVLQQLRRYFGELHSIQGKHIGSVDGSVCNDHIFGNRVTEYGPYDNEQAFRDGIAESLRNYDANQAWTDLVVRMVQSLPQDERPSVLTHGDLVPRNILIRDGSVVGIVDWETAGFYPSYWEYVKAHFFADYEHEWMSDRALDKILQPRYAELSVMLHTRKVFMY